MFLCCEDSLLPFNANAPMTSLKSVESEGAEATTAGPRSGLVNRPSGASGRRFSNVSNLALDLGSTATSAPRLQGCGSLELGFVLEDGASTQNSAKNPIRPPLSTVRRTLSALETTCSGSPAPTSTASAPQYVIIHNSTLFSTLYPFFK